MRTYRSVVKRRLPYTANLTQHPSSTERGNRLTLYVKAIEEELSCLQRDGIVEPVDHSDWATPIVPVRKRDGTVRICGDYKITVNKVCKGDNHPIPRIEDLA
ncbi:hypothetical protein RRG08_041520 [Elysia crispata]|uniref:Reverse transcriptase n=1 Tax=Elysia crispata TaxID=231223 RepID=A0AAE0ZGG8_9GAST|nr:hypothetical protein RRG08_041520 [Elysia crispata]